MNFMTIMFISFLIVFVRSHEETTYEYFQNGDEWGGLCDEVFLTLLFLNDELLFSKGLSPISDRYNE